MSAYPAPRTPGRLIPSPRRIAGLPRAWRLTAVLLPLLLLAVLGGWLAVRAGLFSAPVVRIGDPAPDFELTTLDGGTMTLAELAGRPVIVNFWASWCAPCVEEFPLLEQAAAAHAADGLVVLGIVYRDEAAAAAAFMAARGATWTGLVDPDGAVARRYGIYGPPETFFVGPDGVVAGHQIGQLSAPDLEQQLSTILEEGS